MHVNGTSLLARLRTNNSGVSNTHYKKDQVVELFGDIEYWFPFCIALLSMTVNGPMSTFVPIIIGWFGFTTLNPVSTPAGECTDRSISVASPPRPWAFLVWVMCKN